MAISTQTLLAPAIVQASARTGSESPAKWRDHIANGGISHAFRAIAYPETTPTRDVLKHEEMEEPDEPLAVNCAVIRDNVPIDVND